MTSPTVPVTPTEPPSSKHIGILLFDHVEEQLDAVGPWEILSNWTLTYPQDGWTVSLVSKDGQPVRAAKGMVLGAHHSFADVPPMRVLIPPGRARCPPDLDARRGPPRVGPRAARHRSADDQCLQRRTGVRHRRCAGSAPATTHWQSLELLHVLDPSIDVDPAARFVDDGDVITSAGVSAGIDMALHLVSRLAGADRARAVRRDVQYDPQPPI